MAISASLLSMRRRIFSKAHGIKGIYGAVVAVMDRTAMDDFLTIALPLEKSPTSLKATGLPGPPTPRAWSSTSR